jgi:hypothetical protein
MGYNHHRGGVGGIIIGFHFFGYNGVRYAHGFCGSAIADKGRIGGKRKALAPGQVSGTCMGGMVKGQR